MIAANGQPTIALAAVAIIAIWNKDRKYWAYT